MPPARLQGDEDAVGDASVGSRGSGPHVLHDVEGQGPRPPQLRVTHLASEHGVGESVGLKRRPVRVLQKLERLLPPMAWLAKQAHRPLGALDRPLQQANHEAGGTLPEPSGIRQRVHKGSVRHHVDLHARVCQVNPDLSGLRPLALASERGGHATELDLVWLHSVPPHLVDQLHGRSPLSAAQAGARGARVGKVVRRVALLRQPAQHLQRAAPAQAFLACVDHHVVLHEGHVQLPRLHVRPLHQRSTPRFRAALPQGSAVCDHIGLDASLVHAPEQEVALSPLPVVRQGADHRCDHIGPWLRQASLHLCQKASGQRPVLDGAGHQAGQPRGRDEALVRHGPQCEQALLPKPAFGTYPERLRMGCPSGDSVGRSIEISRELQGALPLKRLCTGCHGR
mmetsp:Transcript_64947/g.164591  ORF Transcript_64947/g.164591 Transcript_64947/m.164591 type:complete len:396 (-) Transcript_64947:104-1291(-)